MICSHGPVEFYETGMLWHVICERCDGYVTTMLDDEINLIAAWGRARLNDKELEVDGETRTFLEWSCEGGVTPIHIKRRLDSHWTPHAAVFTPLNLQDQDHQRRRNAR